MSQIQHAEIDDPSKDDEESDPSDDDQESDPSGGNSSNNKSSGEESAGDDSSSEEESDGDFDIQDNKQSCPYCGKKVTRREAPLHNRRSHSYRRYVEQHVCIYCMEAFPDYFQMIAHQNQCLGNQL